MDLYSRFAVILILIVLLSVCLFSVIKLYRYKKNNPILYSSKKNFLSFRSDTTDESNGSLNLFETEDNVKKAQESLDIAEKSDNPSEIQFAKEALEQAKKMEYVYKNNTGIKIKKVPPVPENLTYSIAFKCRIKNHPNSLEPFCIFYRGEDIESSSPSVFVHPEDMSLVVKFNDNEYNCMQMKTETIPLQRTNLIYLVMNGRKIYVILNKKLFQFKLLESVPVLTSGPMRILPGNASEHAKISYMRYYNYALKPSLFKKKRDEVYEGFEDSQKADASSDASNDASSDNKKVTIHPNDIYDTFYARVFTELVTKNNEDMSRYIAKITAGFTEMSNYNKPSILDIGGGGSFFLKHVYELAIPNLEYHVLDKSGAMLNETRKHTKNIPINFHKGNASDPNLFEPQSFSHITCLYFTVYSTHFELLAENVNRWLRSGGWFVVHFVNPQKFNPVHRIASPFVGINPQRYSKRRLTESQVHFDGFTYFSNFKIDQKNMAYIDEEFHFKNSEKVRKQTHVMIMPPVDTVASYFEKHGLTLKKTHALDNVNHPFEYICHFQKS